MNIFYLDEDPKTCAIYHCDKHRVKMLTEYVQMLSSAHRVLDGEKRSVLSESGRRITRYVFNDVRESMMLSTHINHPSAAWVRQSDDHFIWLVLLVEDLHEIYKQFSKKEHASYVRMHSSGAVNLPLNISSCGFKQPPPAMPDQFIVPGDSVKSYRNFYIHDKSRFATFKQGIPGWYNEGLLLKADRV